MRTLNRLLVLGLLATMPVVTLAADDAPSADPDVTIRTEGDKTIQEYRQNGFLYAIKITPKNGKPYFLVRADGTDSFRPAGHADPGLEDLRVVSQ